MANKPLSLGNYFGVVAEGQTYLNVIYLLLAFPLGLFYFIFLVVGLSLGVGLLIIWVGLLVLVMVFAGSWIFAQLERVLTNGLLRENIEAPPAHTPPDSIWERVRGHLANPVTWKSMLYLFMKFPIGVVSFVLTVAGIAVGGSLLAAPFTYQEWDYVVGDWHMNTMNDAMLAFLLGVVITPLILHVLNWVAYFSGQVAVALLGEHYIHREESEQIRAENQEDPKPEQTGNKERTE